MSRTLPLSEVKAKLSEILDDVESTHERITITRNGRPVATLLSIDDIESMEETIALLSDPVARREIAEARRALADGDVIGRAELDEIRSRLAGG